MLVKKTDCNLVVSHGLWVLRCGGGWEGVGLACAMGLWCMHPPRIVTWWTRFTPFDSPCALPDVLQAAAAPNVFVRIGNGGPIAALTLTPTDTVLDMKRMLLVGLPHALGV